MTIANIKSWQTVITLLFFIHVSSILAAEYDESDADILSLSFEDLLNMTVSTASKKAQKISDAPAIISVVTATEIRNMGATTLADVLAIVPGFTPIARLKSDRLMVVRGLSLKDGILLLIDGVTVNDAFDGSYDFYQRSVDDIERVEVIRGPGSALYGGYAVAAVIHIFTKKANEGDANYTLQLGGGSFGEQRISASIAKDFSAFVNGMKIAGSFTYVDTDGDKLVIQQDAIFTPTAGQYLAPFSNPTLTPTIRQEAVESYNGHINLSLDKLSLDFSHSQLISMPLLSHLGLVTDVGKTLKESTLDRLSAKYFWSAFAEAELEVKIYWVSNESKLFGQSQPPQIRGDEDQNGLNEDFISGIIESFQHKTESSGLEIELRFEWAEKHDILLGLSYDRTELTEVEKQANVTLIGRGSTALFPVQEITNEFMPEGIDRSQTALYIQDLWNFSDKTNVTVGIRFGDYSDFGNTLNPRLAIVHRLNEKFYSKFLYGEAFKPPAFAQLFDSTPTLSQFRMRGNSELAPTEITTFEVQLGYDFSGRLKSNISIFQNHTRNEIFFDSSSGIEQWRNSGERTSSGVEIELKGTWFGLDYAYINYSYQNTRGVDKGAGANIHPAHRLNSGGNYQINDGYNLNFTLSYFSSPEREEVDTRTPIDAKTLLRIALQADNLMMSGLNAELSINNLLDQDGRYEIERSVGLLDDIPLEGRNLRFTLTYKF